MSTRNLSKRELEELRKKEEEEAAAHVFKEFVETFQEVPSTTSKIWVKAGTYDAGARKEDTSERGKLYKPVSRLDDKQRSNEADVVRSLVQREPQRTPRGKQSKDKKKSNLELFKEELRQIQEERSERHKYKNVLRDRGAGGAEPAADMMPDIGSYDTGDPNTTNLYLGNLNPKITEQQLMEIFGRYGPLASIKIMWPRSDEEKARGRNCGFVAFMSRKDGERALRCINGKEIMNYEMKLGWGKAVVIPPVPIYIPPALQQPSKPPPPSGLPFNAQPPKHLVNRIPRLRPGEYYPNEPEERQLYDQILSQSIVKVVVPTERNILMLIHRMVEFVIREGPMFEAIIMNKEMNNPFFRFLFENQSPAHVYYRWKLFSMLQGDSPKQWAPDDFRMFQGGSVWRPPVMNLYTAGMPDELVEEDDAKENIRGTLSNNQRDRLEEIIRALTPTRAAVGAAMAWCLEHAEAAGEVAACLAEALAGARTPPARRVARLYLLSDILHNSGAKLTNASAYRSAFQQRLVEIMRNCHAVWQRMGSRLQREGFRARVTRMLQAWADWAVYPTDFLLHINDVFLGQDKEESAAGGGGEVEASGAASPASSASEGSWDGEGAGPLDGAALRRLAEQRRAPAPHAPHGTHGPHAPHGPHAAAAAGLDDDIDGWRRTSTACRWRRAQRALRPAPASCPRAGRAWTWRPPSPSPSPRPRRRRRRPRTPRSRRCGAARRRGCSARRCARSRCACSSTRTSWRRACARAGPDSRRRSRYTTTAGSSSRRRSAKRRRRRYRRRRRSPRRSARRPTMTSTPRPPRSRRSPASPRCRRRPNVRVATVNRVRARVLGSESGRGSGSGRARGSGTGSGGGARRPRPPRTTTASTASTPSTSTDSGRASCTGLTGLMTLIIRHRAMNRSYLDEVFLYYKYTYFIKV